MTSAQIAQRRLQRVVSQRRNGGAWDYAGERKRHIEYENGAGAVVYLQTMRWVWL